MKTLMNDWLVTAGALVVLTTLFGCDAESKEIGATAEGESSGTETGAETSGGVGETTGGVGESSGGAGSNCAAAADEDACGAVQLGQDSCVWVDVETTDETCSLDGDPVGRCVELRFFGDGCATVRSCVDDVSVFTRELGAGGYEWFSFPTQCGYDLVGYAACVYEGSDDAPCECLCQGLGGIGSSNCDPLTGPPCPGTQLPEQCVPNIQNDGWECAPQEGDPNLGYGDECSLEYSPELACIGATTCLPSEGLGVEGCDGGSEVGCCTQLCSLTAKDASCPDEGQVCSPFYGEEEPPEGYEDVGVCRLP